MAMAFIVASILLKCVDSFEKAAIPLEGSLYLPMATNRSGVISGGSLPLREYMGTTNLTPGIIGNALSFDGQSAVTMGDSRDACLWMPDLCPDGLTLALWLKLKIIRPNYMFIMANGGNTGHSYGVAVYTTSAGSLIANVKSKTTKYTVAINTAITTNTWTHLVLTWDEIAGLKTFINGTQLTIASETSADDQPTTVYNNFLFGLPNNFNRTKHGFIGDLDEVLFWPKKQEMEFVKNLFNFYIGHHEQPFYRVRFADKAFDQKVVAGIAANHTEVPDARRCRLLCARNPFCFGINWSTASQICEEFSVMDWWFDLAPTPGYIVSAKQQ